MIQWTRDGFGLGDTRDLSGYSRYKLIGSDDESKKKENFRKFMYFSILTHEKLWIVNPDLFKYPTPLANLTDRHLLKDRIVTSI